MKFWIYENWQAGPRKLVLHVSTCAFCNDGHGLAGGTDASHGRWHGRFITLEDAERFMRRTTAIEKRRHRCVE